MTQPTDPIEHGKEETVDEARTRADLEIARLHALVRAMNYDEIIMVSARIMFSRTDELRAIAEGFVARGDLLNARNCFRQIQQLTAVVTEIAARLVDKRNEVTPWQNS